MASSLTLYWGSGSIPCWKPMIVLEEKGLSGCTKELISFTEKEHKSEKIMKLNPRGQVPTFKDGDIVVNESGAICFYLESKFPEKKLLPDELTERAKVLQRVFESSNLDSAIVTNIALYCFTTPEDKRDKDLLEQRYETARNELQRWNGYLEGNEFVVGNNFTMADVFFFPFIAFGVRLGLKLETFPAIKAYYERVVERPSVKASWPPHWIGTEGTPILGAVEAGQVKA